MTLILPKILTAGYSKYRAPTTPVMLDTSHPLSTSIASLPKMWDGTFIDISGRFNNGTPQNSPTNAIGYYGGCTNFVGTSTQCVSLNAYTFNGWGGGNSCVGLFYNPSTSNSGAFYKNGNGDGWGIGVGSTSFDNTGNQLIALYEGVRWIPTGYTLGVGWYVFGVTIDSSGNPNVYINGKLVYSDTNGGIRTIGSYGTPFTSIGGYATGGRNYTGKLLQVIPYYKSLSAQDHALFASAPFSMLTPIKSKNYYFPTPAQITNIAAVTGFDYQLPKHQSIIVLTSGNSWTVPSDWNSNSNTVYCIGGGGGGGGGANTNLLTSGGSGGQFVKVSNISLNPKTTISYQIGTGGAGGTGSGAAGTNTWLNTTATISANGGSGGLAITSVTVPTSNIFPNLSAWSTSVVYNIGQRVSNNGVCYQCVTAGTSATTGTGPSGIRPAVTDGSVTWTWIAVIDYTSINSWCNALATGTAMCQGISTTVGSGSTLSYPVVGQLWRSGIGSYNSVWVITTQQTIGGVTTSSTNTITVTAAPNESFSDTIINNPATPLSYSVSNGVTISTNSSAGYINALQLSGNYTYITRLQIRGYSPNGNRVIYHTGAYNVISQCIIDGYPSNSQIISSYSYSHYLNIINCLIVDRQTTGGTNYVIELGYGDGIVANCTFVSLYGIPYAVDQFAWGSGAVINSVFVGYSYPIRSYSGPTVYNCGFSNSGLTWSSNVTSGGGNVYNLSSSNVFVDPLTNFKLLSTSNITGSGSPYITSGNYDIVGQPRIVLSFAWSIGAWQYVPWTILNGGNSILVQGVAAGGGGAGGPSGSGLNGYIGSSSLGGVGGAGDNSFGGAGGATSSGAGNNGSSGSEIFNIGAGGGGSGSVTTSSVVGGNGGSYGGGGGAGVSAGGNGANGAIVIVYNYNSSSSVADIGNKYLTKSYLLDAYPNIVPSKNSHGLFVWGLNGNGQLGNNTTINYSSPIQLGNQTNWKQVCAGSDLMGAIKTDGTLWLWGSNVNGKLGNNSSISYSSPIQIGTSSWKQISVGSPTTAAIKGDGTLWVWGDNSVGQLGNGTIINYSSPIQVGTSTWNYVASATWISAIKNDGTLWTWGKNNTGQLGNGTTTNYSSPIQVGSLTTWKQISNGNYHWSAVTTSGTLWTCGYNNAGQLGSASTNPGQVGTQTNWKQTSAGIYYTMAVKTDGTLWGFGYNASGQLGNGTTANYSSPIQIGNLTNWKKVNAGGINSIGLTTAIKTDGTLWVWGNDAYGQIGNGTLVSYSSPVQVGSLTTWKQLSCLYNTVAAIQDGYI